MEKEEKAANGVVELTVETDADGRISYREGNYKVKLVAFVDADGAAVLLKKGAVLLAGDGDRVKVDVVSVEKIGKGRSRVSEEDLAAMHDSDVEPLL